MTTSEQLAALRARAMANVAEEPAFFTALLGAHLFVHLPRSDDSGRVRLINFTRPDGVQVIPAFTDHEKALAAAGNAARIGTAVGRELFQSAPGATWMLDPNDESCTLYPEEVDALLRGEEVPVVQQFSSSDPDRVMPMAPGSEWIAAVAAASIREMDAVVGLYVVRTERDASGVASAILIALAVTDLLKNADRAVRAISVALTGDGRVPEFAIDLTAFEPSAIPGWLAQPGIEPYWRRSA